MAFIGIILALMVLTMAIRLLWIYILIRLGLHVVKKALS